MNMKYEMSNPVFLENKSCQLAELIRSLPTPSPSPPPQLRNQNRPTNEWTDIRTDNIKTVYPTLLKNTVCDGGCGYTYVRKI